MRRDLVVDLALLPTVLGLAAHSQLDPNAFSMRGLWDVGAARVVQTVQDPNARPLVATLVPGIVAAAVVPRHSAKR